MLWTVVGIAPGGGADGEGARAPRLSQDGTRNEPHSPHKPDPGHDATEPGPPGRHPGDALMENLDEMLRYRETCRRRHPATTRKRSDSTSISTTRTAQKKRRAMRPVLPAPDSGICQLHENPLPPAARYRNGSCGAGPAPPWRAMS